MPILPALALPPSHIDLAVKAVSPAQLLAAVARLLLHDRPDRIDVVYALLLRQHTRRTLSIARGLATPRVAMVHLSRPRAAYLRCSPPVAMQARDGQSVSDVLALLVPRPALTAEHELLHRIEMSFAQPRSLARLRSLSTVEAVRSFLIEQPIDSMA